MNQNVKLKSDYSYVRVTVHVGTDQTFEIEIFAEYKHTLNELLVKKNYFSIRLKFARYDERDFLPEVNCMTCGVL